MQNIENETSQNAPAQTIQPVKNPVGRPRKPAKEKELKKHGRGRAAGETCIKILNLAVGKIRDEKLNEVVEFVREITKTQKKKNGIFVAKRALVLTLIDLALELVPPDVIATRAISYKVLDDQQHQKDVAMLSAIEPIEPNTQNEDYF